MSETTNFRFCVCGIPAEFDDFFVRKDIFSEGGLWIWGNNDNGQIGNNSTLDRSSPVQTLSGGINWSQVAAGCAHSAGIKTDGTLWIWGDGPLGKLGNNLATDQSSPIQTVSSCNNWKQVSLHYLNSAAIKTDGTLWLWGGGASGQLGNNSTINRSSPVQTVSTGANWKQVNLGCAFSAAIKTDGTLWMWGCGLCGRLGQGAVATSLNDVSSPIQVLGVNASNNWKQVSLGNAHSAAIKTDGTLWLWGEGACGKLGNNSTLNHCSPVQTVTTGTNWKQVSIGSNGSAAIKTDGTLWMWGRNNDGQLGNNSTLDRSSPVQAVTTGNNWKQVTVGSRNLAAIKTDGTLWTWGTGCYGKLGDNSTLDKSSPVQTVSTGNNWKQVDTNRGPVLAIREDCW